MCQSTNKDDLDDIPWTRKGREESRARQQKKTPVRRREEASHEGVQEDENLWIASRLIWFDQPRPPDSSQTAPVKIGPSS
ncbi:hypothetical protein STEG23_018612 [Scotinomys teguina]